MQGDVLTIWNNVIGYWKHVLNYLEGVENVFNFPEECLSLSVATSHNNLKCPLLGNIFKNAIN